MQVRWGVELPAVPLEELFRRNLMRFLASGKYIPLRVIADYLRRADSFMGRLRLLEDPVELAQLAGFSMNAAGLVSPLPKKGARR